MTNNNVSWPQCNYCGNQYDPHDIHTCAGNQIYPPRKKTPIEPVVADLAKLADIHAEQWRTHKSDTGLTDAPPHWLCHECGYSFYDEGVFNIHFGSVHGSGGLTRQQIGEALDADRALSSQVGGDHYRKMKIQPVEFIIANDIPFLAANVIKYAARYKTKGGAEDIHKIIHYCRLILEFEYDIK